MSDQIKVYTRVLGKSLPHSRNSVNVKEKDYILDRVYSDTDTSTIYYSAIQTQIQKYVQGYNSTVLAYGQTGSGKTFTMMGSEDNPGIIPLAVYDVFKFIGQADEVEKEYLLRISYLEVYNEKIIDLLAESKLNITVHESKGNVAIVPLKEEIVTTPKQIFKTIHRGEARRHVGQTDYNKHSSRSHAIVRLICECKERNAPTKVSVLHLIDLAGSERANSDSERQREGSFINKSLLTLGTVISKLSKNERTHIPYRDSKLTRILQNSLNGTSFVSMICTINPLNVEETASTLKFATRAKKIAVDPSTQQLSNKDALLIQYKEEIEKLRSELQSINQTFEKTHEAEKRKLVHEKQNYERILVEQNMARTALKERVDHLTQMILSNTRKYPASNSQSRRKQVATLYVDDRSMKEQVEEQVDVVLLQQKLDAERQLRKIMEEANAKKMLELHAEIESLKKELSLLK